MTATSLFDPDPCARSGASPTSAAAWASLAPTVESDLRRVLGLIRAAGGQGRTLDEVCAALGKPANAVSGRVVTLARRGLIERTGATRPTRSGRAAAVWRAR